MRIDTRAPISSWQGMLTHYDPVYTRTDLKWYGSISDPYQFLLALTLDRIQISTLFALGTELEQFHSSTWFERWMVGHTLILQGKPAVTGKICFERMMEISNVASEVHDKYRKY